MARSILYTSIAKWYYRYQELKKRGTMQHITTRSQLQYLISSLRSPDGSKLSSSGWRFPTTVRMFGRKVTRNPGAWGASELAHTIMAGARKCDLAAFLVISIDDNIPHAEVNVSDLLEWAGTPDPKLADKLTELTVTVKAQQAVIEDDERRLMGTNEPDPVLTWPLWVDYEDETNCAEYQRLRCMADVANGNKILPSGKPATRSCRSVIDGDNITEILANLRVHIAATEHITDGDK